ncbi:MAG: 1-acyl-sn-glycerol-3-phosphate acyltransferase [Bacteroidetes bacterium]|nr:1-acyl-sn-glycerol-3-phosphate acyltransferase [Bacteroidota bacterium]MBM3425045.1 glycerol acyltransferase [Bacteroidota bacterium]
MEPLKIDVAGVLRDKNPKLFKRLPNFMLRYLERIIHQKEMNDFLASNGHLKNFEFCDAVVKELNLKITFHGIEKIPKTGPVILVMNHPLGGIDGIALIKSFKNVRQDLVFISNDILLKMTPLKDFFVGINKHGNNTSETRNNIHNMFHSHKAVCIFPAGLVSRKYQGLIIDAEWKKTFVTYAKKTGHTVIPIHIDGRLSPWFYGLCRLRTFFGIKSAIEMLYLADEMYKQKNKQVIFTAGEPLTIPADSPIGDYDLAQQIKNEVYLIPQRRAKGN